MHPRTALSTLTLALALSLPVGAQQLRPFTPEIALDVRQVRIADRERDHVDALRALCADAGLGDVQDRAIDAMRSGRDLLLSSPEGTGKTGAYIVPALERQLHREGLHTLVISPTIDMPPSARAATTAALRGPRSRGRRMGSPCTRRCPAVTPDATCSFFK